MDRAVFRRIATPEDRHEYRKWARRSLATAFISYGISCRRSTISLQSALASTRLPGMLPDVCCPLPD